MSLKPLAILVVALSLSAVLAGCGKKDDKPPATTGTATGTETMTTAPTGATTSPTPTTSPAPVPPETFGPFALKWQASGNTAPSPFTVKAGATEISVTYYVNATGPGPYSIQGEGQPPSGDPSVEVKMGTNSTKNSFTKVDVGAATEAGDPIKPVVTFTIASPAAGSWTVGILGTGNNAQADVSISVAY